MSAFMKPEVVYDTFVRVESTAGGFLVPADVVGDGPVRDFIEGEPISSEKVTGYFARLSAPGYLDATDWSGPFITEAAAREHIERFYDVCADCGSDFEDATGACPECNDAEDTDE